MNKVREQARTRYRVNWRGKIILQIEEMVPVNYDEADPYEIRSLDDVTHCPRWRDARRDDMMVVIPS